MRLNKWFSGNRKDAAEAIDPVNRCGRMHTYTYVTYILLYIIAPAVKSATSEKGIAVYAAG